MAFQLQCHNRECMKLCDGLLDPKTDKVHCSECDAEINVTIFVKNQLKMTKNLRTAKKTQESYSVKCQVCEMTARPVLRNNMCTCSKCGTKLNVTDQFLKIFSDFVKKS